MMALTGNKQILLAGTLLVSFLSLNAMAEDGQEMKQVLQQEQAYQQQQRALQQQQEQEERQALEERRYYESNLAKERQQKRELENQKQLYMQAMEAQQPGLQDSTDNESLPSRSELEEELNQYDEKLKTQVSY